LILTKIFKIHHT